MLLRQSPDQAACIVFFGGEPLSNIALIRQVVDFAEQRFEPLASALIFTDYQRHPAE